MDEAYAEYRCSACKKEIKSTVAQCKTCDKLFFHPGCTNKHKAYDKNSELVLCGPFSKFVVESEIQGGEMRRANGARERTGSTGSTTGSSGTIGHVRNIAASSSGGSRQKVYTSDNIDIKLDNIIRVVREMKSEIVCKSEIKSIIKEAVREELNNVKEEIAKLRSLCEIKTRGEIESRRSYKEVTEEKRKENVIIIKPKIQQESELTKRLIKEKVNIKSMEVGISKLKKGSKGAVIVGCDTGEEIKKLKDVVQEELGEKLEILESQKRKYKLKVINVGKEELELDEENLITTMIRQNKIVAERKGFQMKIEKRIVKGRLNGRKEETRTGDGHRGGGEERGGSGEGGGSLILEVDDATHKELINREKINLGWKKCRIFNYVQIRRCFKCWGFYHIARNCTREVVCHKCAGNHRDSECKETIKKCINCMHKIRNFNLKINDEHDALDLKCPTYTRAIQEEKWRNGWDER